ncbi:hypothetical protein AB205_0137060 [Aquarana catesbeiana]|uniref:Uncharacterized protein n=1 Tax=Aquarana catesbeiana TaxID=8400 RepID=A0A2G9RMN9_AQUCT|nr:hypothetical protein AB205_0137060 [Aquarana catesbeiana]
MSLIMPPCCSSDSQFDPITVNHREVFILQLHPLDEGLDLPASGWADCPSSPMVSTGHVLLHPSSISPHLDTPICTSSPVHPSPPAPEQVHIPHPPEPHVADYLRHIVEVQERQYALTRRLCHSLAHHNRWQLRHYVALERYQRSLRIQLEATRYLGDQMAGINMSLQRLVTRLGENVLNLIFFYFNFLFVLFMLKIKKIVQK